MCNMNVLSHFPRRASLVSISLISIRLLSIGCLLLCAALPKANAAPTASEGWNQLWKSQDVAARTTFRTLLGQKQSSSANSSELEALRGLGTLAFQEDDEVGALQAWGRMIRLAPGHWFAAAYWPAFVEIADSTGRYSVLEQTAHEILKSPKSSADLRVAARLALADGADRAGTPAVAEKQWASLGFVRQWSVIGPFENVSRSGFDKAFPPETGMTFKQEVNGRDGARLHWLRLASVMRNGRCLIGDVLGDGEEDVYYAATAVQSSAAQSVVLCFDPTGASKIFVNGACLFADDKNHKSIASVPDPYQVPVHLEAGWNTLLIKIACKKDDAVQFRLRFSRPGGGDLPPMVADPDHAQLRQVQGTAVANKAEPVGVIALRKLPPTAETWMLIGANLREVQDYDGSAEALRKGLELAPDWGRLHWSLSETLSEDGQTNEAEAERDLARKADSRLIAPALDELEDRTKARKPTDLIHDLTALLAVNPHSASVNWALHDAYVVAKLNDKALQAARTAYEAEPGPDGAYRYIKECVSLNHEKEAERVLALALHDYPTDANLQSADAGRLEQRGQSGAAIAAYRRALLDTAYPTSVWRHIAALYRVEKQWKSAIAAYQLLRRIRPQDATDCSNLADAYRETRQKTEAISLYKEAIRLQPSRVELREKLQLLTGETPVQELGHATPTAPILAQAKTVQKAGAPAVVMLDEGITVIYPDFATVTRYHQIVKVFDEAGVKHYETVYNYRHTFTGTATIESARLIKANGKIENMDISNSSDSVTFPSLAAGDVIDVVRRQEDYSTGGLAKNYWDEWYFDQDNVPAHLSRFVLITPPDMQIKIQNHGSVPEPADKTVQGWRVREWKRTDLPALPLENLAVSQRDRGNWIDLSTFHNWNEIIHWYQDLAAPLCVPDNSIKTQAQELTKGATTETEKIRALVAYVARKIQYQSGQFRTSAYIPTEGKQVLREHYGDCKDKSALLVALLKAVDIPADMVLLSGRDYGLSAYLPSPRFSHAITRIHTAQGDLWVDATADKLGFGLLPYPDQQVPALVIAPETRDLTVSPAEPVEKNLVSQSLSTRLDSNGKLSGEIVLEWGGNYGWLTRSRFVNVSPDQYELALKGITGQLFPNMSYDGGKLGGLQDPDTPVRVELRFHGDQYAAPAGNFLLARLPWFYKDSLSPLLADDKRRSDVELASLRGLEIADVQLELPAGYEVQDLKAEVKDECPYGSYRFTYRVEGNKLIAHSEQRRTVFRLPASELKTYRDFLAKMTTEATRQIVLKKIEAPK